MTYFYNSILACAVLCAVNSASAQTVTVAKSGTPDFSSIQSAITSFASDSFPAIPNVIQITDSALYDEVITIDVPVTIEGTAGSAPTILAQANPVGRAGSAGIVVKLPSTITTGTVSLKNLTILPSRTVTPASCAVNVINNNIFLSLDKVLITGNDGADLPVSSTGLSSVAAVGTHVNFGDDGIVAGNNTNGEFEGAGVELLLRDTVITHLRGILGPDLVSDGIQLTTNTVNRSLHLKDGNVISYMNGKGIDVYGDFDSTAPTKRNMIVGNTSFGIWFHDSPNFRNVRNTILSNNQIGIYESSNNGVHVTVEDSILTNQSRQNLRSSGALNGTFTFRRSTIGNQGGGASYEPLRLDGTASNVVFIDSIVTGNGNASTSNTLTNLGTGNFSFVNSAMVLGGARCLTNPYYQYGYQLSPPVIETDPLFVNVSDFNSTDYYDVASSSYAALATGGAPLKGGADYVGTAAPGPVTPQIVTVSKTGPAGFTTIQDAINSLTLDPTKKYTIQILDNSVYDEIINLTVPATIIGTGVNRPILAVRPNNAGFDNEGSSATNGWSGDAGLLVNLPASVSTATVALKNLIIIPSKSVSPPPYAGVCSKNNNFYLEMENVVCTANNGSDQPLSTDGVIQQPIDPAHINFLAGGAHLGTITNGRLEGDGLEVYTKNCIFTHNRCATTNVDANFAFVSGLRMARTHTPTNQAPGSTGVTALPNAYRKLRIGSGCLFTYNIFGIQSGCATYIDGKQQKVIVYGNRYMGINMDSRKGAWIDNLIVANNTNSGIAEQTGSIGPRMVLTNSILANNGWYNLYLYQGAAAQTHAFLENVTIANQSNASATTAPVALPAPPSYQPNLYSITMSGSSNGASTAQKLYLKNTIVAGNGTANTLNVINLGAQNAASWLTLNSTAVVTQGPQAHNENAPTAYDGLGIQKLGAAVLYGVPVTEADPLFGNTTDPFLPNFYAVQNASYATLGSTGGPLAGGSLFAPFAAGVGDWTMY